MHDCSSTAAQSWTSRKSASHMIKEKHVPEVRIKLVRQDVMGSALREQDVIIISLAKSATTVFMLTVVRGGNRR